ncbi:hypothetical protein P7M35_23185 [Vibrio parahaemolyticus]|nr:hypothetical protein [Vibrio parahaemolyticus]
MNINIHPEFLNELVKNFAKNLTNDDALCNLSGFTPENANYSNLEYQKLYALKYLPAYYFEYSVLAKNLNDRLKQLKLDKVKVLSLGCGLIPDYYALEHNLSCVEFEYYGVDACKWEARAYLPSYNSEKVNLYTDTVDKLTSKHVSAFDVIVFPKSIGDIDSNANLNNLAAEIAKTTKNKLYFLNSFVSYSVQNKEHIKLFEKIHDKLLGAGFTTSDKHRSSFYFGSRLGIGLKGINYNFNYHSDGFELCEEDCDGCSVIKSPILTNHYMDFQILEYSR